MNEQEFINRLHALKALTPRDEVVSSIRNKVFEKIDATPVLSQVQPAQFISPFSPRFAWAGMSVAFALVLVVANQLPMQGAYVDSMSSITEAVRVADTLETSTMPFESLHEAQRATAQARETLSTLKLTGSFGVYTQEQCLQAYTLFDGHLDYVIDYLDSVIPKTTNPELLMELQAYRSYAEESRKEVQARVKMYPSKK